MTARFALCLFICETRKICMDRDDPIRTSCHAREEPGLEPSTESAVGRKSFEGYFPRARSARCVRHFVSQLGDPPQ